MKKEQLQAILAEIGVSVDEFVMKLLNAPKETRNAIVAMMLSQAPGYTPDPQRVELGIFVDQDGQVSTKFTKDKSVAMIVSIKPNAFIAISLHGQCMPFSSDNLFVNTSGYDGVYATKMLAEHGDATHCAMEAATYCRQFAIPGLVKKGEAFLMTLPEVQTMQQYFQSHIAVCRALYESGLEFDYMWTATMRRERDAECEAYAFRLGSLGSITRSASATAIVYPAFSLTFADLVF